MPIKIAILGVTRNDYSQRKAVDWANEEIFVGKSFYKAIGNKFGRKAKVEGLPIHILKNGKILCRLAAPGCCMKNLLIEAGIFYTAGVYFN